MKKVPRYKYLIAFLTFAWYAPNAKCDPGTTEAKVSPEPNYEENVQSLIDRDPFKLQIKPGLSLDDFVRENEDYAFNGVVEKNHTNGIYDFSITNKLTGKSCWISSEGGSQPNVSSVQFYSFDEKNKTLVLQTHEGLKKIPLTRSLYSAQGGKEDSDSYSTNYGGIPYGNLDGENEEDEDEEDELFKAADKDALENYRKKLEALKDVSSDE